MFGRGGWCLLAAGLILSIAPFCLAQADAPARNRALYRIEPPSARVPGGGTIRPVRPPIVLPVPPGVFGFPQFVHAAGMIFSGTVTNIEGRPTTPGQPVETVAVTFHVENALRGAIPGEELTITQWAGLWSSGQRYRMGERVLLFLYPKSKLGLTSCVGGVLGRFSVDAEGKILLTAQHLALFRKDPVLGGKSRARLSDFALAVRHAHEEE